MSKKITPLSNFLTLFNEGVYVILLIISALAFLARFRHYIEENEETRKNDMKKAILTLAVSIFLTLFHHPSFAQQMNLLQCMEYALAHSLSIQQSETALSNAELEHKAAVAAFFPTLSASTSASLSFGRAIDPADNSYTTLTTVSNGYSASAHLPIFSARRLINSLKVAKLSRSTSQSNLEATKENVTREVMSCYFDVVYYIGMVDIAKRRLEANKRSLELVELQFELGQRSRADVQEVEATVASGEYTLISQQNSLQMAYISLRSAMNYNEEQELEINPEVGVENIVVGASLDATLDYALANHRNVLNADRSVRMSEINLSNAKWQMAPSLSSGISFSYNTNYYTRMGALATPTPDWLSQIKGNRGTGLSLGSISFPIFSGFSRRHAKLRAKNNLRNAEINAESVRRSLTTEVTRAYQQMQGYGAQYIVNRKRVDTARLAYEGMEQKFERGMVTPLDLQTSSTALLQAEADMLHTRLSYILQCRIVDFYNGVSFIESAAIKK